MLSALDKTCLIGHTGFIGSSLKNQYSFDYNFNTSNIKALCEYSYDLTICCAAPGKKWIANQNPAADLTSINSLIDSLSCLKTSRFVLISTIDTFMQGVSFTEDSIISDSSLLEPYGLHRLLLEDFVSKSFSNSLIVRLPALIEFIRKISL